MLIAAPAQTETRAVPPSAAAEPASIYGARPAATLAAQPASPLEAAPPSLQARGLPATGLIRRTDAGPTCRGGCAARWYACGPATGDCAAARTTCLAVCAAAPTKFGDFTAAPL